MLPENFATLACGWRGWRHSPAYRDLSGLHEPVLAPVPLRQMTDDLARVFSGQFSGDVVLDSEAMDAVATVNLELPMQAMWALLQNGAKAVFIAPPPCRVTLALRVDGDMVMIDVGDSGAGIFALQKRVHLPPFHTTKQGG